MVAYWVARSKVNDPEQYKKYADLAPASKADICAAISHVRFTPNSDRKSRHRQPAFTKASPSNHQAMSALTPKADMCGATANVR